MNSELLKEISTFLTTNEKKFLNKRLQKLKELQIGDLVSRKNPYLYHAIHSADKPEIVVKALLDAFLASSQETLFGSLLKDLAYFVSEKTDNGKKSKHDGIDLEFDREGVRYLVAIKSGPSWGNSDQIKKQFDYFQEAQKTLRTGNSKLNIKAVNGCCYGKCPNPDQGDYYKYCGQEFWEFLSGSSDLYIDLIQPLGQFANRNNEKFKKEYDALLNRLTASFTRDFCLEDGTVDWHKFLKFNSGNSL